MAYEDEISFSYTSPVEMVAAAVALPIIGITLICLRLYAKSTNVIQIGGDDWFNVGGLVYIYSIQAITYSCAKCNIGFHHWYGACNDNRCVAMLCQRRD